jgi:hypothetical protein
MKVLGIARQSVPRVCRYLRTRQTAPTVIDGEAFPWEAGRDTAAAFWCLHTSSPVGPDDALVHPHECHAARGCFREKADDRS